MPQAKKKHRAKKGQVYDSSLKELVQQQAPAILPLLLLGAIYLETLDVERIRPTMRTDRVYKVMYKGLIHILHLEFELGTDNDIISRLLVYHAILYRDYGLPIISIIVYPFQVKMAVSPWQELSGDEAIVTFNFQTLPLFMLDAEHYLHQHLTCMYPLLPTMQNANGETISQAMEELAEVYRNDHATLAQQFVWMEILLARSSTISPEEKRVVERKLSMYDSLWEEHPKVKQIKAAAKAEIKAARIEAELQLRREDIVTAVKIRFPALTESAQAYVQRIDKLDVLRYLFERILAASDEAEARIILHPPAA